MPSFDVDIDLWCSRCNHSIDDTDNIVCKSCYDKELMLLTQTAVDALELLRPYVSEATLMKPVEISGEVAFKLKEAIRLITGS